MSIFNPAKRKNSKARSAGESAQTPLKWKRWVFGLPVVLVVGMMVIGMFRGEPDEVRLDSMHPSVFQTGRDTTVILTGKRFGNDPNDLIIDFGDDITTDPWRLIDERHVEVVVRVKTEAVPGERRVQIVRDGHRVSVAFKVKSPHHAKSRVPRSAELMVTRDWSRWVRIDGYKWKVQGSGMFDKVEYQVDDELAPVEIVTPYEIGYVERIRFKTVPGVKRRRVWVIIKKGV